MKKGILLWLLAALITGCAGMEQVPESERTFSQVYEAPGASKEQIFTASKIWIAENFRSAKAVIEYENKEDGTLIGNGIVSYPCDGLGCLGKSDWSLPFTMRMDMKDSKFKLTFSNLRITFPPSNGQRGLDRPLTVRGEIEDAKPKLLALGNDLVAAIKKNGAAKDW